MQSPFESQGSAEIARRPARGRRVVRALLAASIGLVLGAFLLEFGMRWMIFSDSALARRLGWKLRDASNFADPNLQDDHWKLQYLFLPTDKQGPAETADPECGWTGSRVRPGTYEYKDAAHVGDRRPVLLYGDSFAACNTEPELCFESLLERSDLSDRYALVNYGAGGYGVDQVYLLLSRTIDQWKDKNPIVVISFLVDNDFDRNALSFRCWPKPRFTLAGGELVSNGPVDTDPDRFLREHPFSIGSYLLRFLAYNRRVLPERVRWYLRRDHVRDPLTVELGRKILEQMHVDLAARGLEHFFLSFHGAAGIRQLEGIRWADELVESASKDLGVPLVETRPYFLAAADGDVERALGFIGGSAKLEGHYNELGNRVAFEALRSGIEKRYGEIDVDAIAAALARPRLSASDGRELTTILGCTARVRTRGARGLAREAVTPYPPFDTDATGTKGKYLVLRSGADGPSEIVWILDGRNRRFRGRASAVERPPGSDEQPPLVLEIRVDGRVVQSTEVPYYPGGVDLDVDLAKSLELEIVADRKTARAVASWIHIADARIESVE